VESIVGVTYLLQHIAAIMGRQTDQVLQERLGIGLSQLRILLLLQHEPGVSQRTLGNRLGQTEASISRQIKLMAEKGYLVTAVNPKSRREHLAMITAKGIKITEAAKDVLAAYQEPLGEVLTEKTHKQLSDTLVALHGQVCAETRPFACDHARYEVSWIKALDTIAAIIKRERV
jgi:DNA-binding MarR family transcriptional regulator